MEKRFYLDSCVWRDLLERRTDRIRPLDEFAFQFLKNCREHRRKVVVSDLVCDELEKYFPKAMIDGLFDGFSDLLIFVKTDDLALKEASSCKSKYKGAHFEDILHALIAKANGCAVVTRDRHFFSLFELVEVFLPEEVPFGLV